MIFHIFLYTGIFIEPPVCFVYLFLNFQICFYLFVCKQESSYVLSLLHFRENGGVVYHGIEEAFPNAVIAETRGMYQQTRPNPSCALISIAGAVAKDGRVGFLTRQGELVDLKNNSIHKLFTLPPQAPSSEDHVGDVVLVVFGSNPTEFGRYQAVCEGVFLHNPAKSTDEVHTRAAIPGI